MTCTTITIVEAKKQWDRLQEQSPARAEQLRLENITGKARRDWGNLTKLVSSWARRMEASDMQQMKEVNERQFTAKMRKWGYTDPQIQRRWIKATSAEKMRAGLARKQGKKTFAFLPKQRVVSKADIFALQYEGEQEESFMSAGSAKALLRGPNALQISDGTKKHAFGGVYITTTQTTLNGLEYSGHNPRFPLFQRNPRQH